MNNPEPLVSVIIITYNQEEYVCQAIESVFDQQSDFSVELIVCNDHSKDNSQNLIEKIIDSYRGKVIVRKYNHVQNLGMMKNLGFALRQCSGKYIAVCEGDDYWTDPLKLQKQVAVMEANADYSMVITNRTVAMENGESWDELYEREHKKNIFSINDIVNGFVPGTQTMLFRNFANLPGYLAVHPEFYYGDRYIAYFCSLFGNIFLLPEITAVYRMTGVGVWSVNTPLEKLHKLTSFMQDFHTSLGIPVNNSSLANYGLSSAYGTLRYCIKRPKLLANKELRQLIKNEWLRFSKMNRLKILLQIVFKR